MWEEMKQLRARLDSLSAPSSSAAAPSTGSGSGSGSISAPTQAVDAFSSPLRTPSRHTHTHSHTHSPSPSRSAGSGSGRSPAPARSPLLTASRDRERRERWAREELEHQNYLQRMRQHATQQPETDEEEEEQELQPQQPPYPTARSNKPLRQPQSSALTTSSSALSKTDQKSDLRQSRPSATDSAPSHATTSRPATTTTTTTFSSSSLSSSTPSVEQTPASAAPLRSTQHKGDSKYEPLRTGEKGQPLPSASASAAQPASAGPSKPDSIVADQNKPNQPLPPQPQPQTQSQPQPQAPPPRSTSSQPPAPAASTASAAAAQHKSDEVALPSAAPNPRITQSAVDSSIFSGFDFSKLIGLLPFAVYCSLQCFTSDSLIVFGV